MMNSESDHWWELMHSKWRSAAVSGRASVCYLFDRKHGGNGL